MAKNVFKDTRVDVQGERPTKFYIGSGQNAATRTADFSATADHNFTQIEANLLI